MVDLLTEAEVLFVPCLVDMGLHDETSITRHRLSQADLLIKNLTAKHHLNIHRQLGELAVSLRSLSNSLYVEAVCLTEVVADALQMATLYYCTRIPRTLASFHRHIDCKGQNTSQYERLWKSIALPMLQTHSLQHPLIKIEEGDYRWFKRFDNPVDVPHDRLAPHIPNPQEHFHSADLKKVFCDIRLLDSADSLGLQIADMLVITLRRACQRTLQRSGWNNMGKLTVSLLRSRYSVRLISLCGIESAQVPYADVVARLTKASKKAIPSTN